MAIYRVAHAFYIPSEDKIPSYRKKKNDRTQNEHANQPFKGAESLAKNPTKK